MSVWEHYGREEAAWDCEQLGGRHFIIQLSSTPGVLCQSTDIQPLEKLSCLLESITRREPSVYPGEVIPKTAVWPVRADTRFPLTPVKMKESCGIVGMSPSLSLPHQSPPIQGTYPGKKLLPHVLPPTSRAVQSSVAGNSSCCSVMLKAEEYYAKIFMHKGKDLIVKEFIMA